MLGNYNGFFSNRTLLINKISTKFDFEDFIRFSQHNNWWFLWTELDVGNAKWKFLRNK